MTAWPGSPRGPIEVDEAAADGRSSGALQNGGETPSPPASKP